MEFLNLAIELFRNADQFILHIAEGLWDLDLHSSLPYLLCRNRHCHLRFLPGDSLLFISGAAAATGVMNPIALILIITAGAIVGNTTNFLHRIVVG